MPTVNFFGFTLPTGIDITINNIPEASWEDDPLGLKMKFRTKIIKRIVEVECEVNHYRHEFVSTLHMRALDLARIPVDLMAFSTGYSVAVFLDTYREPGKEVEALWFKDDRLAPLCTSYTTSPTSGQEALALSNMIALVGSDPALFMALNDLIQANTVPHYAPINCGRAIDGIRNLMEPASKSWSAMQTSLNLNESYLKYISEISKKPRHGNREHIPGGPVQESIVRSWVVMDRFLEFRKRGSQPLPLSEFPLLTG